MTSASVSRPAQPGSGHGDSVEIPSRPRQFSQPRALSRRFRSKEGCTTCRQRRVKCDEVRPRCGQCTRLKKECDWARNWRFEELTRRIHEKSARIGLTSPDALEAASRNWQEMISTRQFNDSGEHPLVPFVDLPDQDSREQRVLTRAPGTFNLILTPGSFSKLPQYGGTATDSNSEASSPPGAWKQRLLEDDDPDIVELLEFEETPMGLEFETKQVDISRQRRSMLPSPYDTIHIYTGLRNGDDVRHIAFYEKTVCSRVMPFSTKYHVNIGSDNRDIIVAAARDFPPLHHAICAITLLSSALRGQPNLLAGAFRHYDLAISACLELDYSDIYSSRFFYLHYIFLLHDNCCTTQGWPTDGRTASRHLHQLFKIARNQSASTWASLQVNISWSLLMSDAQSCLVGTKDAGPFVRAFIENGSSLPNCDLNRCCLPSMQRDVPAALRRLVLRLYRFAAELSQKVLGWQAAFNQGKVTIDYMEKSVEQSLSELYNLWLDACPAEIRNGKLADLRLPGMALSLFNFAQTEYAGAQLYLKTSVYPGQRSYTRHRKSDIAQLCTFVLSKVAANVAKEEVECYNLPVLFLAGFATEVDEERAVALELHRSMEGTSVGCNAQRGRKLLSRCHKAQIRRMNAGGRADEVEWSEFIDPQDLKLFSFFTI